MARSVCVECRTLLGEGESCDAPRHHVASLGTEAGLVRLTDEVWGPPSARRRIKQLAKAGVGGAVAGGLFDGCACIGELMGGGEWGMAIAVVLIAIGLVVIIAWGMYKLIEHLRRRAERLRPYGAVATPPRLGPRTRQVGRIVGEARTTAPGGERCAAYTAELRAPDWMRSSVMLRDAHTAGFEVELDDGQRVRVRPGRIRLDAGQMRKTALDRVGIEAWLTERGVERAGAHDPFPGDQVAVGMLQPGDKVEVVTPLDAEADPRTEPVAYRQAASSVLVPRGVPALRRVG